MDRSLSIVIACFNESENIEPTVRAVLSALESTRITAYEIIIVNDNSTDNTGTVADTIASKHDAITVIHNEINMGFGSSIMHGKEWSSKNYLTVVPGDNEICSHSISAIFAAIGSADIVTAYPSNREVRPFVRRVLSRGFVVFMNTLFGYNLHYYNGPNIYRTADIRKLEFATTSFAFNALAVVQLLRMGKSITEVAMETRPQQSWKTNALRLGTIYCVLKDVARYVRSSYFR